MNIFRLNFRRSVTLPPNVQLSFSLTLESEIFWEGVFEG